jgi:hypothetical protein
MTALQAMTTDDSIETSHRTAAEQRIKAIGVERE